jgi:membrane protease YdiL (CAAX protease family)
VTLVFALFHGLATVTGSDRGQAGLLVGAVVVVATLAVERVFFGLHLSTAIHAIGLGAFDARGILAATGVSLLLLLTLPAYAVVTGNPLRLNDGWGWLLPGLFAQAGIAEEVLFRGYLFRRVRRGRTFWRAVVVASLPFVAVHLVLFVSMPWPIAAAAVLLAAILTPPLAYLFELGGGTVWAPALVHFTIQGAIKLVTSEEDDARLPLVWMAAGALVPYLVFLVPRRTGETDEQRSA